MEKSRRKLSWKLFPAELAILILGGGGVWLLGGMRQLETDRRLGGCVMAVLGLAVIGFHFRREYLKDKLDYDNADHIFRFWTCLGLGLGVSFACGFLPVAGWPFLVVFVMLSLFSNMNTGMLAASVLLMVAVLLNGGAVENYALYLVSGAFAVTLFRHLESDFKFGVPLFLSILCLLVCETASIVLVENAHPNVELFVIPVVNIIVSSLLLVGCLKLFSSMVLYKHREQYLDVNDTENPVLVELREQNRQEYMLGIHTAYFCERIGMQLGLDVDALKCAAYYYRLGGRLTEVMEEQLFPPAAREILTEYHQAGGLQVKRAETAVLVCTHAVVSTITRMVQRDSGQQVDFDKVIDTIFEKFWRDGSFNSCDVTIAQYKAMQKIFKKEKLYYDFLR